MRRIAPAFALVAALGLSAAATAHPLDEGRQEVVFSVKDGHLEWTHDLWLGPLIAMPLWAREIDANMDQALTAQEQAAYARRFEDAINLRIDGQRVPASLASFDVAPYRKFLSLPASPQVSAVFTAPIASGDHVLTYSTQLDPQHVRLLARFPSGGGVRVQQPHEQPGVYSAELSIKPEALASLPYVPLSPAAPGTPNTTVWVALAGVVSALLGAGVLLVLRKRGGSAPQ